MSEHYVHGYSSMESTRLSRQAHILSDFIHSKAVFTPGGRIVEVGCGVGAQTVQLAARNPGTHVVAIDPSAESIEEARALVASHGLTNVEFQECDAYTLPFGDQEIDGAFVCFVLEHLSAPERALRELHRVLKPGANLQIFEGDHGATLAWPDDPYVHALVRAATRYQAGHGGNAEIGRSLTPLLKTAGFKQVQTEPCVAYADLERPRWVEEFTHRTFIDMMKSLREQLIDSDLLDDDRHRRGIAGLERAAAEGTFSYSFYRATAIR
jgi:ubiquinone/menaquinone biosynthesis C-methylase UbiE